MEVSDLMFASLVHVAMVLNSNELLKKNNILLSCLEITQVVEIFSLSCSLQTVVINIIIKVANKKHINFLISNTPSRSSVF